MYRYQCFILEWVDGDTVRVQLDLGFHIFFIETVRINGIDAPEKSGMTKVAGLAAKAKAIELCPPGSQVEIHTAKGKAAEKYGRYLASITLANGKDFAAEMIASGNAKAYDGGKR